MSLNLQENGVEFYGHKSITPISYQVIGERCTGTNFADELVKNNLNLEYYHSVRWKHGFANPDFFHNNHLIIVTFRHAESWTKSLFAKPWEARRDLFDLDFSEFIRHKWFSVNNPNYGKMRIAEPHQEGDILGQPLLLDRHPITGEAFCNIFEMRNLKNRFWLNMHNRLAFVVYVQLEYLQENPFDFVDRISGFYRVLRKREFQPVNKIHGQNRYWEDRKLRVPEKISKTDYDFMISQLDLAQEARIGYAY